VDIDLILREAEHISGLATSLDPLVLLGIER